MTLIQEKYLARPQAGQRRPAPTGRRYTPPLGTALPFSPPSDMATCGSATRPSLAAPTALRGACRYEGTQVTVLQEWLAPERAHLQPETADAL